jgi:hypothetical protein
MPLVVLWTPLPAPGAKFFSRRAQPPVRQRLVESRNDMRMGMQGTALVPAQQIAVWGQKVVQRDPGLEQ